MDALRLFLNTLAYVAVAAALLWGGGQIEEKRLAYDSLQFPLMFLAANVAVALLLTGAMCLVTGRPAGHLPILGSLLAVLVVGAVLLIAFVVHNQNILSSLFAGDFRLQEKLLSEDGLLWPISVLVTWLALLIVARCGRGGESSSPAEKDQ